MVKKEHLSWILDRPEEEKEALRKKYKNAGIEEYRKYVFGYNDEIYRRRIEFSHSLGLKCDCVGWTELDLTRPDAGEILDKIEDFCKKEGWTARGGCARWYEDFESEWYELNLPYAKEVDSHLDNRFPNGERKDVYAIRAYKNKGQPALLGWSDHVPLVVSEKFRDACIKNNIPGLKFCWIRDTGRYASEQYYFMYPENSVPYIATNFGLQYNKENKTFNSEAYSKKEQLKDRIEEIGGLFPRVYEIFADMRFNLQDCYPRKEMPATGFSYAHRREPCWITDTVLIHKDTTEILIKEKVLNRKYLQPALFYDGEIPKGYVELEMKKINIPEQQHFDEMQKEHDEFIKIKKPERRATPKEAVKLLRKTKTARKDDFRKRMKKEENEKLFGTSYEPITPYYLVANGGSLSDEYEFLSYEESLEATTEYAEDMKKEELLEKKIEGIAFAICPDGDKVILAKEGKVYRMSHEIPEAEEEWPSLAQFFVDTIDSEEE